MSYMIEGHDHSSSEDDDDTRGNRLTIPCDENDPDNCSNDDRTDQNPEVEEEEEKEQRPGPGEVNTTKTKRKKQKPPMFHDDDNEAFLLSQIQYDSNGNVDVKNPLNKWVWPGQTVYFLILPEVYDRSKCSCAGDPSLSIPELIRKCFLEDLVRKGKFQAYEIHLKNAKR